jgi:hypothetical protein
MYIYYLRTDDTFLKLKKKKKIRPPPFEEFLEINFQFYIASNLHCKRRDRQQHNG